jgi:CheY-like chemotaxis protein/anti-sigma regulatory factor (Ser/Thr protein kinase)
MTKWAYLLYVVALLLSLYLLFYLYKRKLKYEYKITQEQNQKDLANAASKAKSDFLARVSHEVRTPLNGVLGMSELMQDTQLDEEQKIYTDSILASGKHLLGIINDILDLSKIEAGKLELEYQEFDLLLMVDEIISAFASQAKQKSLVFSCTFDHKIKRKRLGDIIRLKQILFNLLGNAFKFTKEGEIYLKVAQSVKNENRVVFTIEDSGIGIDEKTSENLFKPFVQADSATTRKFGGTGLGLAIVKQLVEKMDGTIRVNSGKVKGSVFKASLLLTTTSEQLKDENSEGVKEVCLLVKQTHVAKSLYEYLSLLNINISGRITDSTECLFIDAFKRLDNLQLEQLSKAVEKDVKINIIGFNFNLVNKQLVGAVSLSRLLPPPVTFHNVKKYCLYNYDNSLETHLLSDYQLTSEPQKILVVEDNIINQQVSIEMLEKLGQLVDIVDTAEEALTLLNRNTYNLLMLDYHLPGMDGFSLLKAWDNKNKTPVILVTADLTDKVFQKSQQYGINDVVPKPYTLQLLSTAIDKAISRK